MTATGRAPDTLLRDATATLKAAGVEGSARDARLLWDAAHGDAQKFAAMVARRAKREPVSRILGTRGFWTLDLEVTLDTLDPRPETETLVEGVLKRLADKNAALRILDLGTGSGCLVLALLCELPNATGLGVDRLPGAVETARRNAKACGLDGRAAFQMGDWTKGLRPPANGFDVVVSNPPYIPSATIAILMPEVRDFDPHASLDGGADGLEAYRAILKDLPRVLAPGALVAFEIGQGQATAVKSTVELAGLRIVDILRDLAGIERCILATAG